MTRLSTLQLLQEHLAEMKRQFGIQSLALFGSVARDEATPGSDVDVLVDFGPPPTFDQYMGLKLYLEDLLHRPVDVVTRRTLRERLRQVVDREAVHVA